MSRSCCSSAACQTWRSSSVWQCKDWDRVWIRETMLALWGSWVTCWPLKTDRTPLMPCLSPCSKQSHYSKSMTRSSLMWSTNSWRYISTNVCFHFSASSNPNQSPALPLLAVSHLSFFICQNHSHISGTICLFI